MKSRSFDAAANIVRTLVEAGHESYLVGGSVRDLIRGIEPREYDIVTSATPEQVRALFARTVPVGESFGVILVLEGGRQYEVATFRTERGYENGRRPSQVEFSVHVQEDVRRRDFTINGLLMDPLTRRILDYTGGCEDIRNRIIRTIGDPDERFSEDHLRMLRALRFAANLDFKIEPDTFSSIKKNASAIRKISAERIRDEMTKILVRGGARRGLELMAETGLLAWILPEVDAMRGVDQPRRFHPEGDVWQHTLRMLEILSSEKNASTDARLAWSVLLHDVGKPLTRLEDRSGIHFYGHTRIGEEIARGVMQRLRFSRSDTETVAALIHNHMLFMNVMEMRPNRLKRFLRIPDFPLHLELHRLDCLASHGDLKSYEFCRTKLSELNEEDLRPPRLISGEDLISMGFQPGPVFSEILEQVESAQLDHEISTPEEARKYVLERWGDRREDKK
ncbi:MAG: CCA tRNA nucleotidyltransferase [Syntrophales bacterium]